MSELNLLKLLNSNLFLGEEKLFSFIRTAPHRYKTYEILKKDGVNKRLIAQPSKEVKILQRTALEFLATKLPIHETSFAYTKDRSIKHNAILHKDSNFLLKIDLSNFFNSITPSLFLNQLKKSNIILSLNDKELISHLFFWKENRKSELKLSIGAPSSPLISNFIMFHFDEKMKMICKNNNCIYSRYADDMTISSKNNFYSINYPKLIQEVLNSEFHGNLKINNKKTKYISKAHHRHVTGITITNDNKISVGSSKKRLLSSKIHHFKQNKLNETKKILELKGELSFAFYITPELKKIFINKYGQDTILNILKYK